MDISILEWLGEHRSGFLTKIMSLVTKGGSEIAVIAIVCFAYWCMNRRTGNRMLLTMVSGLMLNQLLKILFVTRRPWLRSARVKPVESALPDASGYSFPSGHTTNAVSAYGGLAYGKAVNALFKVLAWVLIALIGLSRLYLGVHTPQDVLVSLAAGIALLFLMDALSEKLEKNPALDIPICACILLTGAATLLITLLRTYPPESDAAEIAKNTQDIFKMVGAMIGLISGWLLERRFIRFEKPSGLLYAACRFVLGLVLVLALLKGLKPLFGGEDETKWLSIVRYAATCLGALFVWPLIFTKIERKLDARKE